MWTDLLYRLRALLQRRAVEDELNQELQFHLEQQVRKLTERGATDGEAIRSARMLVGGPEQVREECRDARGTRWLEDTWRDLRYAGHALRKSPAFAIAAILSLALGIGANTSIFSVLNAVMLKKLPVREPQQLVELARQGDDDSFTYPLWEQIRDRQAAFSGILAYSAASFNLARGGEKRPAQGLFVSGDYFKTLGVSPALGRLLTPADDKRGGGSSGAVAVISYGFWQREYGRDPHAIGKTIWLDGHPFAIAGITPAGFFGVNVGETFDVAIPITSVTILNPGDDRDLNGRAHWWLNIIARLPENATPKQAEAQLALVAPAVFRGALPGEFKPDQQKEFLRSRLTLKPAATGLSDLRQQYGQGLALLMGMVGVVLLIACVNVANLLLARAQTRQREIAVRMAIGASRTRLMRQLLTESLLIAAMGAAAGLYLARWSSRLIVSLTAPSQGDRFLDVAPDSRVLLFTLGVTLLTGILFGLAPAWRMTRLSPSEDLKERSRLHTTGGQGRATSRNVLVAAQVALSFILLVAAGLFAGSLRSLLTQDMGFNREGVLLARPDLRATGFPAARQVAAAEEIGERLRSVPGVQSVARSAETPIDGGSWQWDVRVDVPGRTRKEVHCFFNLVSPDYFHTLDTTLLAGRDFSAADQKGSLPVAIVNETAARKLFGAANPIGMTYHDQAPGSSKQWLVKVVGLAANAKYLRLRDEAPPTIYLPLAQNPAPFPVIGTYELRFAGRSGDVIANVKKTMAAFDGRLAVEFQLLSKQVADSLGQERLLATLAGLFGGLALLLTSVGLYGTVAYAVATRRGEIGIRMALGATSRSVLWLILQELGMVLLIGIGIGMAGALACSRLVRALLYGLAFDDPRVLAVAGGLLIFVAIAAAYFPARRATLLDPLITLREE